MFFKQGHGNEATAMKNRKAAGPWESGSKMVKAICEVEMDVIVGLMNHVKAEEFLQQSGSLVLCSTY